MKVGWVFVVWGGLVDDEKMWVGSWGGCLCFFVWKGEGRVKDTEYMYIYFYILLRDRKETETWWDDSSPQQISTTILEDG